MEVKIQCECGAKYAFEVEPVHNRMPAPVACPTCGADGTSLANDFIQAEAARARGTVRVTPRLVSGPAAPSPAPSVHINHPPAPVIPQPPVPVWRPQTVVAAPEASGPKPLNPWVAVGIALLVVASVGLSVWKFGAQWSRRLKALGDVASVLGDASAGTDSAPARQNFFYEDNVTLFIKHTNHLAVAETFRTYWKEALHKNLTAAEGPAEEVGKGEFLVHKPHNGYVRIMSTLDWPPAQFEAVSRHLSKALNTMVFESSCSDFSGAYHFGVYDRGDRKFHAQMEIKISGENPDEIVTTDGNEWALANGYKPGEDGFKGFDLSDGDEITQRLGMKFWDEEEAAEFKGLLLRE